MLPLRIDQEYPHTTMVSEIRDFFNNFSQDLSVIIPNSLKHNLQDLRDFSVACISSSDGLMVEFNTAVPVKDIRVTFDTLFESAKERFIPQLCSENSDPLYIVASSMTRDFLHETFHNLRYAKNAYIRFLTALYNKKRGSLVNRELENFYMYFNNARDSFIEAFLSSKFVPEMDQN